MIFSILMAFLFVFQSMQNINQHTYSTGISNFHQYPPNGITCFFADPPIHMSCNCGKTFHL